jgi:quercetin dioxygenase-like cupin family protein
MRVVDEYAVNRHKSADVDQNHLSESATLQPSDLFPNGQRLHVPMAASGAIVGHVAFPSIDLPFAGHVVLAQNRKPVMMTRLYTGPDGQAHAEEVQVKFAGNVFKMLPVTGAELHRGLPGSVADWHTAPRRQYVITLSGRGEIEVPEGKKISIEPGHIDLVEDVSGKGHITKVTGTEDRVTLWLPLGGSGQSLVGSRHNSGGRRTPWFARMP